MAEPPGWIDPNPSCPGSYPSGYGYPPAPAPRPGAVLAASVLGYVVAGLLFVAGTLLLFGASLLAELSASVVAYTRGAVAEILIDAGIDLVGGGLLIGGGLAMTGGRPAGRGLFGAGAAICIASGVYWLIRTGSADVAPLVGLFVVPAVIALLLAWLPPVSDWLRSYSV